VPQPSANLRAPPVPAGGLWPFHRVRAGACFCARQGTRSEVWSFQISDEERRLEQKQARPFGLRGKCRHAALRDLTREPPLPAPHALPGDICRSNADCAQTVTDPRVEAALLPRVRCVSEGGKCVAVFHPTAIPARLRESDCPGPVRLGP